MPDIALPTDARHPVVACTRAELARLRQAYRGKGAAQEVVAAVVRRADRAVGRPVVFPPRGAQHNQWYQCEKCQLGLKTLSDTRHKCPGCGKVYSGPPYDDVIFARRHAANLRNMDSAAWAYAITGKDAYARLAAEVLLGYARRYRKYPYHDNRCRTGARASRSGGHLNEQTLGEACYLALQIAPAYDLIHDAAVLSADDHRAIRDGLLVPMLQNIDKHKAGRSNWQTWHNAGMLWGGAVLGRAAWVRKALAARGNGFASQMKTSVTGDGMWYENSWGYHFYTLRAMVRIAEGARRLGIGLYSHPALKKMFTVPAAYTMSDGSLPRFGDDVNSSLRRVGDLMEVAYHAYGDEALLELLPTKPLWETVLLGRRAVARRREAGRRSRVFPSAGHAILRTRGPAGLSAAMTFGPYGGFHGHLDKLSFVFFGHRRELGVDPGRAASQAYRLPIHRNWYKATLGHNAVIVDAASQRPAAGRLDLFAATDTHAAAGATCEGAYPGVTHRRLLLMTPTYLLVFDRLAARKDRRFDWVYHNRGKGVRCRAATQPGRLGRSYAGQEHVHNVRRGDSGETVRVQFVGDAVTTHLTVAGAAGTEVRIGDGPRASVLDRAALAMITRRGRQAVFAAVLDPVQAGHEPAVTGVAVEQADGRATITVRRRDQTEAVALGPGNALTLRRGEEVLLRHPPGREAPRPRSGAGGLKVPACWVSAPHGAARTGSSGRRDNRPL